MKLLDRVTGLKSDKARVNHIVGRNCCLYKQYRCAAAMYFWSLISVRFNIVLDRALGTPGHGKGHRKEE
eukprot:14281820-Ditylum_brightwellii.AAC.1